MPIFNFIVLQSELVMLDRPYLILEKKTKIIFITHFVPVLSISLEFKLISPVVWKLSAAEQQPVQELVMDLKHRH